METNGSEFEGKAFSVFGDSISTFEGMIPESYRNYYTYDNESGTGVVDPSMTWWMILGDKLGARFLSNASYSGATVAGKAYPVGRSKERAQALIFDDADSATPDIVFVFNGINDYGWGDSDAQLRARAKSMPQGVDLSDYPEAEAGVAAPGTLQDFAEAYDEMLENIKETAPNARIYCMTLLPGRVAGQRESTFCYSLRGIPLDEYNKAIRMVAQANGCQVIDLRRFGFDYESTDGTHPNVRGMQQLAELAFASLNHVEPSADLFPSYLRSERTCERENCIGCEYAQGCGNQWSCVCEKGILT